jgi:VHL beta domain
MTYLKPLVFIFALLAPNASFAMEAKCRGEAGLRSLNSDAPAQMQFTNQSRTTALIYWINFEGKRVLYQKLPTNSSYTQDTYLTHPWVAISRTGRCLGVYKPRRGVVSVTLK